MNFEDACCEIDYIIEHLDIKDKNKIPINVRNFFKNNRSLFYKVNLDVTKDLSSQTLKDETKAFLEILYVKYFANRE